MLTARVTTAFYQPSPTSRHLPCTQKFIVSPLPVTPSPFVNGGKVRSQTLNLGELAVGGVEIAFEQDDESQVWQGRVTDVKPGVLVVRIEGERESFPVSEEVDVRKNRKRCELRDFAPRDFVTVVTVGVNGVERAVKVRGFSKR